MKKKNILPSYSLVFSKVNIRQYSLIALIIFFQSYLVSAKIPQSAKDDPRYELGYLVVTYYAGVNTDGTGDCAPGINEAIYDANDKDLVLLFPPGVYQVKETLKCYHWATWNAMYNRPNNPPFANKAHTLVGISDGDERAVIKLAADAVGFDNPSNPMPVIVWRYFTALNSSAVEKIEPDDPFKGVPANYKNQPNVIFGWVFRNIDIDLNDHAGAIGGHFSSAQRGGVMDVRIDATNAYAGIYGVPGRNSFIVNTEIEGGQYGIINFGDCAGAVLVGSKLYNQTESALISNDFCPYSLVGFDIVCKGPQAIVPASGNKSNTSIGTMTMVDGKIEMIGGGLAIDNSQNTSFYAENVYVKGDNEMIKNGSQYALTGTGAWQHIKEFAFNDPAPPSGTKYFNTYSLLDGNLSQNTIPVSDIEDADPSENIITRHKPNLVPVWTGEDDGTINVKQINYGAKGDGVTDDWKAIQDAINFSPNGHIFLPKGDYVISKPLVLKSNTKMFGVDQGKSRLCSTSKWVGGSDKAMVETVSDPDATTFFGFIGFWDAANAQSNTTGGYIHWKAGRNSMIFMTRHMKQWGSYFGTDPRYNFWFTNNAGGKIYICPAYEDGGNNKKMRHVLVDGTQEPLTFYGLNIESTLNRNTGEIERMETNIEIKNSKNIRIHSIKREATSPSIIIRDSENIGMYGMGRLNWLPPQELGGFNQILGKSNNILFATIMVDNQWDSRIMPILEENITGEPYKKIDYPNCISLYKRGELTDLDSVSIVPTDARKELTNHLISVNCYPNPVKSELNISITASSGSKGRVIIYNLLSNIIYNKPIEISSYGTHNMKWLKDDSLPSGIYFVKIELDSNVKVCKIQIY